MRAGAIPIAWPREVLWLNPAGWVRPFPGRHSLLSASRDLIEWHTRRLVEADPAVSVLGNRGVAGLRASADGRRVTGVALTTPDGTVEALDADLVVDATGRRSALPDWLERMGRRRPAETRIDAHLAYATREYRRPAIDPGFKAIFVQGAAGQTRTGVMFPIEGDRLILTLQGVADDRPPTDADGFDRFMATMRTTVIRDTLAGAEPLTDVVGFANTANRRRHVERMRDWPERFLAVGDSVCAFNPIYGQGMSVAAQTAAALDRALAGHRSADLDGLARPTQRLVAKAADAAWLIATGDDLRLPTTTGATANAVTRLQQRYLDRVLAAATTDETVLDAMCEVFFLLAPPTALFRRRVMSRVLGRRADPPTDPPARAPRPAPALQHAG